MRCVVLVSDWMHCFEAFIAQVLLLVVAPIKDRMDWFEALVADDAAH
ncbi:hypothetical protein HWC02_gp036 [Gordonia phage Sombrero]|uniref:Uncharacterized protein n=1 Tax=Gordonia phage Sombrero TaxID=2502420 RepID=A0A411BR37_9CAUD|nr:hypothetical protein HWC02_gp036 [Gordonia phage Sombrero]QAY04056.1 hypothetical protein SEA_SOMBRERO_97 [Gordonia phage Sombrero]